MQKSFYNLEYASKKKLTRRDRFLAEIDSVPLPLEQAASKKLGRLTEKLEHLKASLRAKVEHPFHVVKNLFRHRKTRYRGLPKTLHSSLRCSLSPIRCWPAGALRSLNPVVRLDKKRT
jgi:hypothetical protein